MITVGLLLGVLKFSFLFFAIRSHASAGLSSLILQTQIFFTIGLSAVVFNERLTRFQGMSMTISAVGFFLFLFPQEGGVTFIGLALVSLAALTWAAANLVIKMNVDADIFHLMVWASLVPPLPLLLLSWVFESHHPWQLIIHASTKVWLAVIFMAYAGTIVAYGLWGTLLNRYPAATVTPFALLIPIIGICTSTLLLGEQWVGLEIFAAALIMIGLTFQIWGVQKIYHKGKDASVIIPVHPAHL